MDPSEDLSFISALFCSKNVNREKLNRRLNIKHLKEALQTANIISAEDKSIRNKNDFLDLVMDNLTQIKIVMKEVAQVEDIEPLLVFINNESENKGFLNSGNSCSLNSVLQLLFHNQYFVSKIVSCSNEISKNCPDDKFKDTIIWQLRNLLKNCMCSDTAGDTTALQKVILWSEIDSTSQQKDASEITTLILSKLSSELDSFQYPNFITKLFSGKYKIKKECSSCRAVSSITEVFMLMWLPLSPEHNSLEEAIASFLRREENIKGTCEACNYEFCTRTLMLENIPNVLLVALKSTQFDTNEQSQATIPRRVGIPFNLTIQDIVTSQKDLKLMSAVVHSGTSTVSGHFTTYVKSRDHWKKYSDDTSSTVSRDEVYSMLHEQQGLETPSLLLYELMDTSDKEMHHLEQKNHSLMNELRLTKDRKVAAEILASEKEKDKLVLQEKKQQLQTELLNTKKQLKKFEDRGHLYEIIRFSIVLIALIIGIYLYPHYLRFTTISAPNRSIAPYINSTNFTTDLPTSETAILLSPSPTLVLDETHRSSLTFTDSITYTPNLTTITVYKTNNVTIFATKASTHNPPTKYENSVHSTTTSSPSSQTYSSTSTMPSTHNEESLTTLWIIIYFICAAMIYLPLIYMIHQFCKKMLEIREINFW